MTVFGLSRSRCWNSTIVTSQVSTMGPCRAKAYCNRIGEVMTARVNSTLDLVVDATHLPGHSRGCVFTVVRRCTSHLT